MKKKIVLNECRSDLIRSWTVTRAIVPAVLSVYVDLWYFRSERPAERRGRLIRLRNAKRWSTSSLSVCTPYGVSQAANHGLLRASSAANKMPFLHRIPFFHLSLSRCSSAPTRRRVIKLESERNFWWRDRASFLIIKPLPQLFSTP